MAEEKDLDSMSDDQLMGTYSNISGDLVNRATLSQKMGSQYGGDRNIYDALGYPRTVDLGFEDFYARYLRQDMAKALIDKPVNATWRGGFKVREEAEKSKNSKFREESEKLIEDLDLRTWFTRLDKLTGLGHFGILLFGFDDAKKEEDFAKPVASGKRGLYYVKAFGEQNVEIKDWENDTTSKRYGMPVLYSIEISDPTSKTSREIQVHHSRVIHVTDGALETDTYGRPRLEAVFNRLMDLEKVTGGDAEMFWRGARPGYAGYENEGYNLTPAQREQMKQEIREYEHNLRRFINLKGMSLESLAQQISDPANHVDVLIQMISAVMGIPKRILIGSERGELASSEDRTQWLSEIKTRREEFAEAKIVSPFFDKCIQYRVISKPVSGFYSTTWEDLFAPSKKEKAEVGNTRAEALYYYTRNMIAPDIITPKIFFKYFLGFSDEEAEEAAYASTEEQLKEITRTQQQEEGEEKE